MSILHGSWLIKSEEKFLFIWGETWQALGKEKFDLEAKTIYEYPFLVNESEKLCSFFKNHQLDLFSIISPPIELSTRWQGESILLPTQKKPKSKTVLPILSEQMKGNNFKLNTVIFYPWEVKGFYLNATETVNLFQRIPLGEEDYLGADLKFWSHIYRWSLDLICRCKFLPILTKNNKSSWQPLLDSSLDQTRLAEFIQLIPSVCRSYAKDEEDNFIEPQELILDFLGNILDTQLRLFLDVSLPSSSHITIQSWLQSLQEKKGICTMSEKENRRLVTALDNWTLPIQESLVSPHNQLAEKKYRTCFKLTPPSQANLNGGYHDWQIIYYIQALDDPDFLIPCEQIWPHLYEELIIDSRIIEKPQEILLKGLGLASRLYAPIAHSLEESTPQSCSLNPIQVYEFIRSIAWQLQDNGLGVILPNGLASGGKEKRLGVKIEAKVTPKKGERLSLKSLLKYNLTVAVGNKNLSKKEFNNLLEQKSPIVEIDGEWIALQPADVRAAQEILDQQNNQLNLTVEDALRLNSGHSETIAKLPLVGFEASGVLQELINNLNNNSNIEIIPTPSEFKGKLRPYQQRGFSWLSFLEKWNFGACLADDMGLGKTIQLIAFLVNLKQKKMLLKPTLIVCPTSIISNWEKEVKKFTPTLKTIIHHGDKRKKGNNFIKQVKAQELVITSYSLVYRDLSTLNNIQWQGVVLDEAQNIKNPQAKQSQAVRKLNTEFRIALTGTPVENRLSELWSILDFLNPGYLGNSQFFQRRFAIPIEKYGDKDSLKTLRSLVQPFILRRLKSDKNIIQDLPEKQEMNVFCGLSTEQANLYQQLVDKSLEEINQTDEIKRRGLILTLLMKLKQICNHPAHFLKEKTIDVSKRSGKLLRLEEMLEELIAEGDRALIFTQFSEWGKLLKPYLEKKIGVEILFLYGATGRQEREEMVARFQNDPQAPPIFILSLKAGGTGLNLTRANHVFHIDRWWNPAVENQATDRAFRIGQKQNVQVHKFVSTGTLEEKINEILESKKQLAEQTINTGEKWLTELDTDQLRNLLLLERNSIIDEDV
jgi:SNF2 family DNA or RNA helicase